MGGAALKLAVVGKDVSESPSPRIHKFLFGKYGAECEYDRVSVSPSEFPSLAETLLSAYDGLNVTIPFKGGIIPYLTRLEGDAEEYGAVNTVVCRGRIGYNTDGGGFLLMLENEGVCVDGERVLVLGAGGAGRSCIGKLCGVGAHVDVYDRDSAQLWRVFSEIGGFTPLREVNEGGYAVVLNCTGVGMHGTVGQLPAVRRRGEETSPEFLFEGAGTAIDLIYTPGRSAFLASAERAGRRILNGSGMLFYQAYLADCIFLGKSADAGEANDFYAEYRESGR